MPMPFEARDAVAWYDRAKTARSAFETTWNAARRVFFPGAQDFVARNDTQGRRDRNVAVDGHGILAVNDLADYLVASLCSPASKWLGLAVAETAAGDPSPSVRQWLDQVRDLLLADFHDPASNFDDAMLAVAKEYAAFGNSALYIGDRPGQVPLFLHGPLAQSVWELDADGELGRFGWRKRFTARQAIDKWGAAKLSEPLRNAAGAGDAAADTPFDFLHVMDRNPDHVPGSADVKTRRWRVRWIECDQAHVISTSFLEESCYAVFSAPRMGEEAYGRGCGDNALEDTHMAQRVRVSTVRGMEKQVDPPTIVPDDGVVSLPTSEARGLLVVRAELMRNGNVPVASLKPEGRPDLGLEVSKIIHEAIDRHFLTAYTRLPREPRMPTQQIIGLQEEQMRALGPLLSRLQRPLGHVVQRVYGIRARDSRLPPAPPDLAGRIMVKLEAPALRQMRMAEARAFIQWLEVVGMATQVDPGVIHVPRLTDGIALVGLALGVPQSLINSADDVARALQTQAATAEDQAGMEQAKDLTTAGKNIAPLLKVLQGGRDGQEEAAA